MRYFIHLAYDGTRYHGWQIQPNGISVEGEIERCLTILLGEPINIVGAGRTDAGVHARHMVAHVEAPLQFSTVSQPPSVPPFSVDRNPSGRETTHNEIPSPKGGGWEGALTYRLNRMLPPDICVYKIEQVADDMHARFSATARTYHYYLTTQRDPFNRQYTWQCHYDLDFALMNEAASILMEYSDFAAFCKSHTDVKTTLCTVTEAKWIQTAEHQWYFRITANRFLRNMVRAVVGTLVEVGRHRMTLAQFREVIEGKQRTQAGESMPAHALFLEKIEY